MVTDDVAGLWKQYGRTHDLELRNRLVLHYAPLVKYVVGRVRSGLPRNVDDADLISEGVIGLMDAIDKFQPARGLKFQTYAVPRIRGAIIDGLRASDWVPRSVRATTRHIERVQVRLETRLGHTPSDSEIAQEMQVSVQELRQIHSRAAHTSVGSIDELGGVEDIATVTSDLLEDQETRAALRHAIRDLPERDRIIVALYYFEGLTLSEVGQVLGVTESRVSQLHSRIAVALRDNLTLSAAA